MPGRKRMYLAGLPYHLVQRGNNREVYFVEPENYQYYLQLWQECSKRYGIDVHAYCLMCSGIASCSIINKRHELTLRAIVGSAEVIILNVIIPGLVV